MALSDHWTWLKNYREQHADDPAIQEILALGDRGATAMREAEFLDSLAVYQDGYRRAQEAKLLELELIYRYWANISANNLRRGNLIENAVKIVVKAQRLKPEYYPWYPFFQWHLASVYQQYDPLSYDAEILEIYDILETHYGHMFDLMAMIKTHRAHLQLTLRNHDQAEDYCAMAMDYTESDSYYFSAACQLMAHIHYVRSRYEDALMLFKEAHNRSIPYPRLKQSMIRSIFYQGVCLTYLERPDEAHARFDIASRMQDLYHGEMSGFTRCMRPLAERNYEEVIALIDDDLHDDDLTPYNRFSLWLARADALQIIGQPYRQELQNAKAAAQELKYPERYEARIADAFSHTDFFRKWHGIGRDDNG